MRKTTKLAIRIFLNVLSFPVTLAIMLAGAFCWAYDEQDISYWEYMKQTGIFR